MTERTVPLGVQIIAVLGIIAAIFSIFGELAMVISGGIKAGVGVLSLMLSVIQVGVLLALLELQSWAWSAAVVLLIFGTLVDFMQGNTVSGLISVLILSYLVFQKPIFQTDRNDTTT